MWNFANGPKKFPSLWPNPVTRMGIIVSTKLKLPDQKNSKQRQLKRPFRTDRFAGSKDRLQNYLIFFSNTQFFKGFGNNLDQVVL